jgi:hypothetical protein
MDQCAGVGVSLQQLLRQHSRALASMSLLDLAAGRLQVASVAMSYRRSGCAAGAGCRIKR